jgi:LysM repeat protein
MRRMINIVGLVLISILVTVIVVNSFAQVEIQPEGDEIYYVKKIYVVKKGDTISDLRSIIGVDFRVEGEIEPGKTINFFVPKKNWTGSEVYVVKKGDTPEKIAQKLGVPGYKLLEWNPEMGCRFIYVGQGLIYKTKGEFEKGLKELETETKKETKKLKNEIEKGLKELEAKRTRNYTRAFKRQNC